MAKKKKKILFIDDNPGDGFMIKGLLSKHGFDVFLAQDGAEGQRMVQEIKPDIILLDILLPGISGIELCKKFKQGADTKDIPVIFYTSMDTPIDLFEYASYGASKYVQKSSPPQELIASIRSVLN